MYKYKTMTKLIANKGKITRKEKPSKYSLSNLILNIYSYYRAYTEDISNTQQNLFAALDRAYNTYQKLSKMA